MKPKKRNIMKAKTKRQIGHSLNLFMASVTAATSFTAEPGRWAGMDLKDLGSVSTELSSNALDKGLMVSTPVAYDTGYDLNKLQDRNEVDYEMQRDDPYLSVWNFADNLSSKTVDDWMIDHYEARRGNERCFLATIDSSTDLAKKYVTKDLRHSPGLKVIRPAGTIDERNTTILTNLPYAENLLKLQRSENELRTNLDKDFALAVCRDVEKSRKLTPEQRALLTNYFELESAPQHLGQHHDRDELPEPSEGWYDTCTTCRACHHGAHRKHTYTGDCSRAPTTDAPPDAKVPIKKEPKEEPKTSTSDQPFFLDPQPGRRRPVLMPVKKEIKEEPKEPKGLNVDPNKVSVPNLHIPPAERAAISHLHRMFAHPSNDQLGKMLERGGAPDDLLSMVKKFFCPVCDKMKKPQAHRKAAVPKASRPNQGVAMDVMFLYDNRTKVDNWDPTATQKHRECAIQNYLDIASTFHRAGTKLLSEGQSWNSRDTRDAFDQIWTTPFGVPDFVLTDAGPENVGPEWREYCQYYGIFQAMTAAEAPWEAGLIERHGGALKFMIVRMMNDSSWEFTRIVRACVIAKTRS